MLAQTTVTLRKNTVVKPLENCKNQNIKEGVPVVTG